MIFLFFFFKKKKKICLAPRQDKPTGYYSLEDKEPASIRARVGRCKKDFFTDN